MKLLQKNSLNRMIFLRSAWTILGVSLACILLSLGFLYTVFLDETDASLRDEISYITAGVEMSGQEYLLELTPRENMRITWIGTDGQVLFDSQADPVQMENHSGRPEIQDAFDTGYGKDRRISGTLSEWMIYRAERISDGSVVRLALEESSPLAMLAQAAVPLGLLLLAVMILAVVFAAATSRKIITPINRIDLHQPDSDSVYVELQPLAQRITAQNRQIQEQMRLQEETHEAQDRYRREFTANVSHELKTPLTSISGFAEIIRDGLVRPEDIPHFADTIYREAQRLIVLVGDIIKISRMDDQDVPIQRESVDLYQLSKVILERLEPAAETADVTLHLSGKTAVINGSYQIADEMIYNLCDNAIKYNRPGGHVYLTITPLERGARLRVQDTGIGIAPEHQDRVFERFYRVDKTRSRQIGGTGLGLSIVKHGALFHDAALRLDSTPGKGTTITIDFPK